MQKAEEILTTAKDDSVEGYEKVERASKELAVFALDTFADDLRDLALNLSKAGMDFASYFRREDEKDGIL